MTEREELFHLVTHSNNPAWRWLPNNAEMLRFVDYLLANGVTIQKWIPVWERMPEVGVPVLAYNGNDTFVSEYYRTHILPGDEGYMTWVKDQYACYPTHWMPLPEPPKGE